MCALFRFKTSSFSCSLTDDSLDMYALVLSRPFITGMKEEIQRKRENQLNSRETVDATQESKRTVSCFCSGTLDVYAKQETEKNLLLNFVLSV